MRAVVQRVRDCSVTVGDVAVAAIDRGLLVYLGVTHEDSGRDAAYMADKVLNLRIFPDDSDKMNLSAADLGYSVIVVSQFTLYGDVRKGRRPSWDAAAPPEHAEKLYLETIDVLKARGIPTYGGRFQAKMQVAYVNDGPVTILIDSQKQF